jgi:hypothetical protein
MSDESTNQEPEQQPLPGTTETDWEARAKKAEADLAKDRDAKRKASAESKRKADAAAAAKAAEDGKLKEELDRANTEKAAAEERMAELEAGVRSRIDTNLAKLPKEVQAEIEEVKDHLPLGKLDALVSKRLSAIAPKEEPKPESKPGDNVVPPPAGMKGDDKSKEAGHQIHPETKEVLKRMYVKPNTFEIAKELGVDGVGKFGWHRTDDDDLNKANFINFFDRIAKRPEGGVDSDTLYNRVLPGKK